MVDKFQHYDLVVYAARSSSGARRLATALGSRRWRDDLPERYTRRRPYFRGNDSPMVLNWGSTVHPKWLFDERLRLKPVFVNSTDHVKEAVNKLTFFQHASRIDGIPLLKWTDKRDTALAWIGKGKQIVCRTKLDGSSGEGIVLAGTPEQIVEAPLYTRYYPKTHEFRVHVFNGKVIDFTQKKLKGEESGNIGNRIVRSLRNGWVHAHDKMDIGISDKETVGKSCISIISGLDLVFGAVDVLAQLHPPAGLGKDGSGSLERSLKSFKICEVNTAPGLENSATIEAYKNAVLELKEEYKKNV